MVAGTPAWGTPTKFGDTGLLEVPSADTHQSGSICVSAWVDQSYIKGKELIQVPIAITLGLGAFLEAYGSYPNLLFNGHEEEDLSDREFSAVGMKMRVLGERSSHFKLALDYQIRQSISDEAYRDGLIDRMGRVIASAKLGVVSFHANAGLLKHTSPEGFDYNDQTVMGAGIELTPITRGRLVAEVTKANELYDGFGDEFEAAIGLQYYVSPHLALSVAYTQGLSEGSPDWRITTGFYTCQGTGIYIKPIKRVVEIPEEELSEERTEEEKVQKLEIKTLMPRALKPRVPSKKLDAGASGPASKMLVEVESDKKDVVVSASEKLQLKGVGALGAVAGIGVAGATAAANVPAMPSAPAGAALSTEASGVEVAPSVAPSTVIVGELATPGAGATSVAAPVSQAVATEGAAPAVESLAQTETRVATAPILFGAASIATAPAGVVLGAEAAALGVVSPPVVAPPTVKVGELATPGAGATNVAAPAAQAVATEGAAPAVGSLPQAEARVAAAPTQPSAAELSGPADGVALGMESTGIVASTPVTVPSVAMGEAVQPVGMEVAPVAPTSQPVAPVSTVPSAGSLVQPEAQVATAPTASAASSSLNVPAVSSMSIPSAGISAPAFAGGAAAGMVSAPVAVAQPGNLVKPVEKSLASQPVAQTKATVATDQPAVMQVQQRMRMDGQAFEGNGFELTPEGKQALDMIADSLKTNKDWTFLKIDGYTDNVGSAAYNENLSLRRATESAKYLVTKHGVDPNKLLIKGNGERGALVSNATAEGRAANRRVEFLVLQPKGATP